MELDHVVLCVEDPPAAERALIDFGVTLGLHAVHTGQGTANACAFFDNAYLELLWRQDDAELQSEPVRPVALWERVRWRQTGASPFGIAFRPGDGDGAVETWPYAAPFLPAGAHIPIVTPRSAPHEPLVFLIPAALPIRLRTPVEHRGKRRRVTGVGIFGPQTSPLPGGVAARDVGVVMRKAAEHHLELEWDDGASGGVHDFRPVLPLTLRW